MQERRTRRSDQTEMALGYQLQSCVERAGLAAMVLADRDGLLVASSQWEDERCEELAAVLPMLARGSDFSGLLLDSASSNTPVVVSTFQAAETNLFLCAVGEFGQSTHREIARAKVGLRRILH